MPVSECMSVIMSHKCRLLSCFWNLDRLVLLRARKDLLPHGRWFHKVPLPCLYPSGSQLWSHFWLSQMEEGMCYWHPVFRGWAAAKHPAMCRTAPQQRISSAPNVNSANVENSCSRVGLLKLRSMDSWVSYGDLGSHPKNIIWSTWCKCAYCWGGFVTVSQ